ASRRQLDGATVAGGSESAQDAAPIDEIIVSGTRRLAEMRKEMVELEDRFLARYNELNKIPEFAINCYAEAAQNSRFLRRTCRPVFVDTAIMLDAQDWVRGKATLGLQAPTGILQ